MGQGCGLQYAVLFLLIHLSHICKRRYCLVVETDLLALLTDPVVADTLHEMNSVKEQVPDTCVVKWMLGCGSAITWSVKQLAVLLVHFVVVCDGADDTPT